MAAGAPFSSVPFLSCGYDMVQLVNALVNSILDVAGVFDVFDELDVLWALETYHLQNQWVRQSKHVRGSSKIKGRIQFFS